MKIPKAKHTVGDQVLVIRWGETLNETTHYFGTVALVEANPDIGDSGLSPLKPGEAPILYTLKELVLINSNQIHLWEHEITCSVPER